MPIPFLVWPAVALATWGAKKLFDAHGANNEARETSERATRVASSAETELKSARRSAQVALEELGALKLEVWRDRMGRFVEVFGQIRNVELQGSAAESAATLKLDRPQLAEMRKLSGFAHEVLSGGVTGLGAGALVGIASYGGAMMFASASTGTAIATLSGAAATNATLAFFGGGALAAGGAGIAGGMAVLGGLVAGPALLVFGWVLAAKADENLATARKNLGKAQQAASKMKVATTAMLGVAKLADRFSAAISVLDGGFQAALDQLQAVVDEAGRDYSRYSKAQRRRVYQAVQFAQAMKILLETPLLEKSGAPRLEACEEALRSSKALARSDRE